MPGFPGVWVIGLGPGSAVGIIICAPTFKIEEIGNNLSGNFILSMNTLSNVTLYCILYKKVILRGE